MTPHRKALATLFDRDHSRLLGLLEDVQFLCLKGSHLPAARVFGEFRRLQEHHMKTEDDALAQLREAGQCPPELFARVASEHAQVKSLMHKTWVAITGGDHTHFLPAIAELIGAVTEHERVEKEELLVLLAQAIPDPVKLDEVVHSLVDH